ncbi:uncharacterized protein LOC143603456 [Bidens hawaiensis]|uniref:uncharacterized protein LOC143603456 n=1 Tax=Bidens hawaiensis TaxID=980011 RepID=UPI0040490BC7
MGSSDPDFEHRRQLKVAGELLSEPPASVDDLLHILDQLDKLLQMVEQSPKEIMKEALVPSTRALVSGSLLEHPNMDVRVSVASCLCELTKITAPEQPYCDEEMRGVFRCIVSVLDNLSDKSCRYFDKMVAILDNVAKVRACALMLDIDNELVVRLFEHFLNSVRDHHRKNVCSLMADIMVVVLLESEEISPVILRTLFASVKNNVGVLPVARKLGEEVFIRCADKLRPYIDKTVATLGGLLVDYSPLLTSILDGEANLEHKDESASVQSNVFDTPQSTVPLDDATQVNTREEMVTEKAGNVSDTQLMVVEGAVDQSVSSLTSKLDTTNSNVASKPDTTESVKPVVSETVHGENVTEKGPEIVVPAQKPLEESEVTNAASQSGSQEDSQIKIRIKKGTRSKKKSSNQHGPPSTVPVLTTVNEGTVDQEMKSPKRARKKTPKAEENKPSVNTGSDVEPVKSPQSKPAKRSRKKISGDDSMAKKPKLSGKKALESKTPQKFKKVADTGDSEVKPAKWPAKKDNETDSDGKLLKPSVKRRPRSKVITKPREDVANRNEDTDSDNTPLKQSVKTALKVKVKTKPSEDASNNEETESDNTPLKQAVRKGQRSKVIVTNPSEDFANEETESDNTPLKQSENKGKEMDSDPKPVNLSENIDDEETDSDNIPLKLTAKRVNKSGSSMVKSSKIKDSKKQGRGKTIQKDQTKSLSGVVDGLDVPLKSVLKKATKGKEKEKSEGARSAGSKRKRSVTKKKVTKTIKYDASLVDQKVKVWWPDDKMYYEGVVESYDSAEKKHKVLYLDGETETLNLKKEKWELIKEYSTPVEEVVVAIEAKHTDIIPEMYALPIINLFSSYVFTLQPCFSNLITLVF